MAVTVSKEDTRTTQTPRRDVASSRYVKKKKEKRKNKKKEREERERERERERRIGDYGKRAHAE